MSEDHALPVPDGMQVTKMQNDDGPCLVFYTGRFATEYNREEVEELVAVLNTWLRETKP